MHRAVLCLLAGVITSGSVGAETIMSSAEFEAWSTGRTLEYHIDGKLWGSETHLAGRATIDADAGGACRSGYWYPAGDDICFVYDVSPGPYCWRFLKDGDQVFAAVASDPLGAPVSVTPTDTPIPCSPEVGV